MKFDGKISLLITCRFIGRSYRRVGLSAVFFIILACSAADAGFGGIIHVGGDENSIGTLSFSRRFEHIFMDQYQKYVSDVKDDERCPQRRLLGGRCDDLKLGWFPDIDSRKFEVGYGVKEMTPGEQLLYGLGVVLLQMSAAELDRSINH